MKPEITLSNYEEFLLLALDGELDTVAEAALFAFLDAHPELAEEVAAYEATKVPFPEMKLYFEEKEALLKREIPVSDFRKIRPFLWSAAALLLLWVGLRTLRQFPEKEATLPQLVALPKPVPAAPQPTVLTAQIPTPTAPAAVAPKEINPAPAPQKKFQEDAGAAPLPAEKTAPEFVAPLPVLESNLLPENPVIPPMPAPVAVASVVLPKPVSGFEVEIQAVDALRAAASEKLLSLQEKGRNIKNTETTFYLGKHELFTIRF